MLGRGSRSPEGSLATSCPIHSSLGTTGPRLLSLSVGGGRVGGTRELTGCRTPGLLRRSAPQRCGGSGPAVGWVAVCTALTSVSRQVPQGHPAVSLHWQWAMEAEKWALGGQYLDAVGAGGLPLQCINLGRSCCLVQLQGTLFT